MGGGGLRTRDRRRVAAVLALASVAAVAGLAYTRGRNRQPRPDTGSAPASISTARFIGAQACKPCHAKEYERWSGSDHELAMQEAGPGSVLGNFDGATFAYHGVVSTFSKRDGKYVVRTDGADGKLAEFEVKYTFGVRPLQQYLLELPGGRLQALNVCWDTRPAKDGGQRWFHLYPNENVRHDDAFHWTGPYQNWNFMCAECHSTNVRKNYRPDSDRYETRFSEINVACEACHGPGSEHAAWGEAVKAGRAKASDERRGLAVDLTDRTGAKWEFDMQRGIAQRTAPRRSEAELETCARCHARRGVTSEDYVFGRPLLDTHRPALLEEALYYPDGQIKDEVYEYGSFLQSRMHMRGVTCSDCHDPHNLKVTLSPDGVCSRCHLREKFDTRAHHFHQPGSTGSSCVACHMPPRNYMVVDPRRDHSFRRPRPDLTVKLGSPNACTTCHRDRSAQWAAAAAEKWWPGLASRPHYGETLHAGRTRQAGADRLLGELARDPEQPGIVRATAVELLGAWSGPATLEVLASALRDADPLVRMAALPPLAGLEAVDRRRLLAPLLADPVRTVRVDAARPLAVVSRDLFTPQERASLDAALIEYRQAQQANLDRAEGHMNLGTLAYESGRLDEAQQEYQAALAVNRWFVPAYVNLADVLRAKRQDAEAERVLRRGIEVTADSPDLHHALGLALARSHRLDEALTSLRKAAELDPGNPRNAYVYGVALKEAGQMERALAVLEKAQQAHPGDRDVLIALATFNQSRHAQAAAVEWARKLLAIDPADPQAQALLRQIELPAR